MKLGLCLHPEKWNDRHLAMARQLGCETVIAWVPFGAGDGYWHLEDYVRLRDQAARHGLVLEGVENFHPQHWDYVMVVGLRGAYLCCNEFFKYAPKRKCGRIVNLSSARAHQPNDLPNLAYATTKLGVHCLTRSYAAYGARFGVTVNTLAPGMILTENLMKRLDAAAYERDTKIIALRRPGTMDEIADGLIFLYECGFVTGETVNINGGQTYAP